MSEQETSKGKTSVKKHISIKKRKVTLSVSIAFVVLLLVFGTFIILEARNSKQPEPDYIPLANDDSMSYEFNLTASGKHTVKVSAGDSFTVSYKIYRTDADTDFNIYAVQNEIEYDPSVFELVEDSITCKYTVSLHSYDDGRCRVFMNAFSSSLSGFEYKQGAEFGSFTLKVKDDAEPGSYTITSNNCGMAVPGGGALYSHTVNDLTVEIESN